MMVKAYKKYHKEIAASEELSEWILQFMIKLHNYAIKNSMERASCECSNRAGWYVEGLGPKVKLLDGSIERN